ATQLIVPSINGHNPDLEVWAFDPAGAKALLDEARADGVPVDDEITIIGRIGIYPNATEAAEAMLAMYQQLGLNVKLQMLEVAEWVDILTKPYADDRQPAIQLSQHDNNNGDAVFTVYNKYHTEGGQSTISSAELDATIEQAEVATGEERTKLWQQAFKMINDDIIADIPMFHMVGFTRVGPDLEFTPDISTNSELQLSQIKLK
ncbi:MAG: ABC transporter substrate-binding protein, partial [Pseudomonadota bacterium]